MIRFLVPLLVLAPAPVLRAQELPLPDSTLAALASELSGEAAQRNLEFLAREHRMRGSRGFRRAADHILAQLQSYGIADARIEQFPADGRTYYGTQRSRPPWDAEFAELWELRREGDRWVRHLRLASWETMPVTLAQDSESGEAVSELVDVGEGTAEADYAGKDVRGKLVLAGAQPGAVAALAITRFGAAGILSYAQNQRTAWWGENENLVRWGHLGSFEARGTFAFMLSLQQARQLRQRLARGETIRLEARVRAGQHPGFYDIVTATIPGSDPARRDQEIVFSCHLDHQRPGANDNASGCVTILEVARALSRLIADRRIAFKLKEAGLAFYNHNLETARSHFPKICTTHTYDDRVRTIQYCKEAGIGICSGGIFGMGESPDQRIELAVALQELDDAGSDRSESDQTGPNHRLHPHRHL